MAVTATLTPTDNDVNVGDLVELVYAIAGADDEAPVVQTITVGGKVVVDNTEYAVESAPLTITKPAVTHTKTYERPTAPGLSFQPTSDPRRWTAVAALA